ncbi:MAG TPA: hypothetical protein P5163_20095 [Rubrivivax sp.]|nr:hypothetical protein [Rubrivivax sp.]HRZ62893.1 hypothetical protein [Rubrivivax sp.]
MNCGKCGAWSSVGETRKADRGFTLARRRRCANGHTFTTYEVLAPIYRHRPSVVRKTVIAAEARGLRAKRDAAIVAACKTRTQAAVAIEFGVSRPMVSKVLRNAC